MSNLVLDNLVFDCTCSLNSWYFSYVPWPRERPTPSTRWFPFYFLSLLERLHALAVDALQLDVTVIYCQPLSARGRIKTSWENSLQDQSSIGGDEAREATVTVGVVAGNEESGLLAERHATIGLDDALVPTCKLSIPNAQNMEQPIPPSTRIHTLDELANTDLDGEVTTTDAAVELGALAVRSTGVVEVAGVLHGDGVAVLGLVDTVAGSDDLLSDTHSGCCEGEVSGGGRGGNWFEESRSDGAGGTSKARKHNHDMYLDLSKRGGRGAELHVELHR